MARASSSWPSNVRAATTWVCASAVCVTHLPLTPLPDVGACQMIVDGKIKLKSGTQIERFTEKGLKFEDGTELEADTVIYATGYAPTLSLLL